MSQTSNGTVNMPQRELFGHPVGLYVLFFTEMWERFSYYGMRAILVLFVGAQITGDEFGGMGWTNAEAINLVGWYTMMVYVMGIPGGILADRVLGAKKTVMLGGALLCIGHGILAINSEIAFFAGLVFIVLGVGGLKPNISTMVGGLYQQGDIRRDKGFTIFYMGINLGALIASITVGAVAEYYGWHAGFGLAGIGMVLGQVVYVWGQKYLTHVGNSLSSSEVDEEVKNKPLTKIEIDRIIVLLLSFIIIIVFWGGFEQASGLLNLYTQEKIDRVVMGFEIPTGIFQGVNSFFILLFGLPVASYWVWHRRKGWEGSTLLKMAIGTIIMGVGFLMMSFASTEASSSDNGKGALIWLILAYLLHTLGELCASPTALSFITKLAPLKYASLMMGAYFAATGFGNKLASYIGEKAQSDSNPIEIVVQTDRLSAGELKSELDSGKEQYVIPIMATQIGENVELKLASSGQSLNQDYTFKGEESKNLIKGNLQEYQTSETEALKGKLTLTKQKKADVPTYEGIIVLDDVQNDLEYKTFTSITIFTAIFGLLLIVFLKRLKKLTHGAEEKELENSK